MSIIPVVNEKDRIIGYKDRKEIKTEDIYRVSALWITNSHDEVLIAQRSYTKKNDPGKWGPAVAGTVEKGETYIANIVKEAYEELGLKNIKPKKGPKYRVHGEHNHFGQWYFLNIDKNIKEFKIQAEEVENIKWIAKHILIKDMKNDPSAYLKSMPSYVEKFCR